jgi:hypothetical protein
MPKLNLSECRDLYIPKHHACAHTHTHTHTHMNEWKFGMSLKYILQVSFNNFSLSDINLIYTNGNCFTQNINSYIEFDKTCHKCMPS